MVALERKNAKLSTKLNKVRRKSNELFEENNNVRGKHEESQKILTTVTQLFEDSKSHIKELKNEKNDLERRLAQLEEKLKVQDLRMRMLEQERKELEDHALEQEMEWSYQEGINSKLREDVLKKENEIKKMSEELRNMSHLLKEHKDNIKLLRESTQHCNEKVASLQDDLANLRRNLQENEMEKSSIMERNQEQEKCIYNQDGKIAHLTKHLNDIKHGLADMDFTITVITEENTILKENSKIQQSTNQELKRDLVELTKVNTNQELIIQHLNLRIQSLLSDRDSAEKEVVSANQNLQQILLQHINLAQTVIKRQNNTARLPGCLVKE